jgi:hypothetical protein
VCRARRRTAHDHAQPRRGLTAGASGVATLATRFKLKAPARSAEPLIRPSPPWQMGQLDALEQRLLLMDARRSTEEDRMSHAIETAINELREAISSYHTYCHFVERGMLLVNADMHPFDVIEAARLNVEHRIEECRALGLNDHEIETLTFADDLRD